jgi:hypothetical protein
MAGHHRADAQSGHGLGRLDARALGQGKILVVGGVGAFARFQVMDEKTGRPAEAGVEAAFGGLSLGGDGDFHVSLLVVPFGFRPGGSSLSRRRPGPCPPRPRRGQIHGARRSDTRCL